MLTLTIPGNTYGTKDVYNAVTKMRRVLGDESRLEKYLADVQLEGGLVKYKKNKAEQVAVLWVQTRTMRQDIERSKPWSWQTDTTFSTNRWIYKWPYYKSYFYLSFIWGFVRQELAYLLSCHFASFHYTPKIWWDYGIQFWGSLLALTKHI